MVCRLPAATISYVCVLIMHSLASSSFVRLQKHSTFKQLHSALQQMYQAARIMTAKEEDATHIEMT